VSPRREVDRVTIQSMPPAVKRSSDSSAVVLPRGRRLLATLSPEQVAMNQRVRILLAMIDVVEEKGYAASTIVDVAARAGVSRNSFYAQFASKQECFLQTYDAIMATGIRRTQSAYRQAEGWPGRVQAAITALFEGAVENPAAIRLSLVEIAAAGAAGIERRERAMAEFERFIRDGLELAPGTGTLPGPVMRASLGGLNRILYTRVRNDRHRKELLELVPDLVTWATSYYPAPAALLSSPGSDGASATPRPDAALTGGRAPGTLFPRALSSGRGGFAQGEKNLSRSFVVHSQRERILDAVANLTAAKGFAELTVEDIVGEAAVSREAFYEHFKSKQDAFLVAYELGHAKGLGIVERAFAAETDWRAGVRAAAAALLQFLASEPAFAHIALLDALTATPLAAERSERGVSAYAQMLRPGFEEVPTRHRPPAITIEAIVGGLFELFSHYAARGRTGQLRELTPHATYIALAPFIGAEEAAAVASEG
jgi:AcrR family transcriptional regulator